jgi:hypothetical protein
MSALHRDLVSRIRAAARQLEQAVATVPAGKRAQRPRPGEWSVQETLIHLRNVLVYVHGLRIRRLCYETEPVFADFDEPAFRQADLARGESAASLVRMSVAELEQLAAILEPLPPDRWQRQGRHPELGPMSIELLAQRAAEHTVEHARQIADTARLL